MVDAGGAIPRGVEVPLHVGVVSEHFTVGIEVDVVLVAEAGGDNFPLFSFGIGFANPSAGSFRTFHEAAAVNAWHERVFAPAFRDPTGVVFRQLGLVAADDVEGFAIGAGDDGVGAVLAAVFLKFAEEFDGVELVIAIGVFQTIKAAASMGLVVDHDVEGIEGVAHSPGVTDIEIDLFDVGILEGFSGSGSLEAVDGTVLVTGEEAAFVVFAKNDPGTEFVLGNGIKALYQETFLNGEPINGCGFGCQSNCAAGPEDGSNESF